MRREFYKTVPSCCFNLVLYVIRLRPANELDSETHIVSLKQRIRSHKPIHIFCTCNYAIYIKYVCLQT